MKTMLSICLSAALLPGSMGSLPLAEQPVKAGDLNGDGVLNLKDVVLLRRYIAGGWKVSVNEAAADFNGDGNINLKDVILLRRTIADAGAEPKEPEQPTNPNKPIELPIIDI